MGLADEAWFVIVFAVGFAIATAWISWGGIADIFERCLRASPALAKHTGSVLSRRKQSLVDIAELRGLRWRARRILATRLAVHALTLLGVIRIALWVHMLLAQLPVRIEHPFALLGAVCLHGLHAILSTLVCNSAIRADLTGGGRSLDRVSKRMPSLASGQPGELMVGAPPTPRRMRGLQTRIRPPRYTLFACRIFLLQIERLRTAIEQLGDGKSSLMARILRAMCREYHEDYIKHKEACAVEPRRSKPSESPLTRWARQYTALHGVADLGLSPQDVAAVATLGIAGHAHAVRLARMSGRLTLDRLRGELEDARRGRGDFERRGSERPKPVRGAKWLNYIRETPFNLKSGGVRYGALRIAVLDRNDGGYCGWVSEARWISWLTFLKDATKQPPVSLTPDEYRAERVSDIVEAHPRRRLCWTGWRAGRELHVVHRGAPKTTIKAAGGPPT